MSLAESLFIALAYHLELPNAVTRQRGLTRPGRLDRPFMSERKSRR
jgi:hypothetical protein